MPLGATARRHVTAALPRTELAAGQMARPYQERSQRLGPQRPSWLRHTCIFAIPYVNLLSVLIFVGRVQTSGAASIAGETGQHFPVPPVEVPLRYPSSHGAPLIPLESGQGASFASSTDSFRPQTSPTVEEHQQKRPAVDARRPFDKRVELQRVELLDTAKGLISDGSPITSSGISARGTQDTSEPWNADSTSTADERSSRTRQSPADSIAESLIPPQPRYSIKILLQPVNTQGGQVLSPPPTVEVVDRHGDRVTSFHGLLNVQLDGGDRKPTGELSQKPLLRGRTIARADKGYIAWKNLTIDRASTNYYLRFLDLSGLVQSPALSDRFNVFPGLPTELVASRQPPAAVDPGEHFDVSFELRDSYGNPPLLSKASDDDVTPYTMQLTLINGNGVQQRGTLGIEGSNENSEQESGILRAQFNSRGTAIYKNLFVTNVLRGDFVLKGVCTNCVNGPFEARSRPFRVMPSSAVTIYSECSLLVERAASEGSESERQCMLPVKLSQKDTQRAIAPTLGKDVRVRVGHVKLLGILDLQETTPGIRILPKELVFHAGETLGVEKAFTVEAIDDGLPWAAQAYSAGFSPSLMQHYRIEVDVDSEDPLWTAEAVVWPNGNSVDLLVQESNLPLVAFDAPGHLLLSGPEGEMEYFIALSAAPTSNLVIIVEQTPGISAVPDRVLFTPENWHVRHAVKVHISEDGLTDPSVVTAGTTPGRGSRILVLRHRVEWSGQQAQDASDTAAEHSDFFRMKNNGFLSIVVIDADAPAIKWDNSEVLVKEGNAFELAFQFGNKPAADVHVRLDCESPYIRHVKRQTTVLPEDWLFGDEFLLQSQIRPDFDKSAYSVTCYVTCVSKDPRFNFDRKTIPESERETAIFLGLEVKVVVHKKLFLEDLAEDALVVPSERLRDRLSGMKVPSDTTDSLVSSFYFTESDGILQSVTPWCPVGYRVVNGKCQICPANTYSYVPSTKCFPCRIGYVSPPGAPECRLAVANRLVMHPESSWFLSSNAGRFWSPPQDTKYSTQTCGFDMSGEYSFYGLSDCVKTYKGHMNPSIPFDGRFYTCPEGFTIGLLRTTVELPVARLLPAYGTQQCTIVCPKKRYISAVHFHPWIVSVKLAAKMSFAAFRAYVTQSDQQCWEPVRGNYSLGAHSMACKKGTLYRTAENKCRPCEEGFSCKHDGRYNSWMTRCTPGYGSATGSEDCQKCQAGYFCPGYMEPFHVPPLKRYPGWYESGEPPKGDTSRYIMQGFCGMGTYGRSFIEPEGQAGEYYAPYNKTCVSCPPGHYCYDVGIVDFQDYKCTFGHYCLGGDSPAIPCPPGRYYPFRGAYSSNSCLICPDGFICETLDQKVTPELCPEGHICPYGRQPMRCPAGTFNPYKGQSALEQCNRCPAGYYCPDVAGQPVECPVGTYSPHEGLESEMDCMPCPPGYYCDELGLTLYHKRCEPGGYCEGGASVGPYQTPCPEGTFGLFYAATSSMHCQPCPAGSYCPEGATAETVQKCPAGYYCEGGAQLPCPPGYLAMLESLVTANDCVPCKPGYYCHQENLVVKETECPAGHYCPLASAQPTPCPPRTFNIHTGAKSVKECASCPPGNHCPEGSSTPKPCPADDAAACASCPRGHYCLDGTPTPCGVGKYSGEGATECKPCPKGFYCPTDTVEDLQLSEFRCPPGAQCPEGTGVVPLWLQHQQTPQAPKDTVTSSADARGNTSSTGSLGGMWKRGLPSGFFARSHDFANARTGVERRNSWSLRGFGTSQSRARAPGPTISRVLSAGSKRHRDTLYRSLASSRRSESFLASPGLVVRHLSSNAAVGEAQPCPAGHYCNSGQLEPVKCPPGTYNPLTGKPSASACLPLPAGYFCKQGGCTTAEGEGLCAAGHYCPEGSTKRDQRPCPAGTFRSKQGGRSVTECWPCSSGSLCPSGTSTPVKCPQGSYCPYGTNEALPCPVGTYGAAEGAQSADSCKRCPIGKYCSQLGATAPTGDCADGFFCKGGAITPTPPGQRCPAPGYCPSGVTLPKMCPDGKYIPSHGAADVSSCIACLAGNYCKYEPGKFGSMKPCSAGYYCMSRSDTPTEVPAGKGSAAPAGSTRASLCLAGTYTDTDAQAYCKTCPAGLLCSPHGIYNPLQCPVGYYCPDGAISALACPKGTYGGIRGLTSETHCTACPAGSYCGSAGLNAPSGQCEPGYYCSEGSSSPAVQVTSHGNGPCPPGSYCPRGAQTPTPCAKGKYNPSAGQESEADCVPCPAGWYCARPGLPSPTGRCPPGVACTEGSTDTSNQCPAQTYAPEGSETCLECAAGTEQLEPGSGKCNPCSAGWACTAKSRSECPEGYYCPAGTIHPYMHSCPLGFSGKGTGLKKLSDCLFCPSGGGCTKLKGEENCGGGFYCTGAHTYTRASRQRPNTYTGSLTPAAGIMPARPAAFEFPPPARVSSGAKKTSAVSILGRLTLAGALKGKVLLRKTQALPQAAVNMSCVEEGVGVILSSTTLQVDNVDSAQTCMVLCQSTNICSFFSWNRDTGVCQLVASAFSTEACRGCSSGPKSCNTSCFMQGVDFQGTALLTYLHIQRPIDCQARCASDPECGVFVFDAGEKRCYTRKYDALQSRVKASNSLWAGPSQYCEYGGSLTATCRYPTAVPATVTKLCDTRQHDFSTKPAAEAACQTIPGCTGVQFFQGNSTYSVRCGEPDDSLDDIGGLFYPQLCGFTDLCEPGYYCPPGSGFPTLCDEGKFCPDYGLTAPAGDCEAGFWCGRGEKFGTPGYSTCPKGHYCPKGAKAPVPCPEGTYRSFRGGSDQDHCTPCTPGSFCSGTGLVEPSGLCSKGFYCRGGNTEPAKAEYICPVGSYCPAGSPAPAPCPPGETQPRPGQYECVLCPAGLYCGADGQSHKCQKGFYCPEGTQFPQQYPCPPGSYLDYEGARDISECVACPEGRVCDDPGSTEASVQCPAGHYCEEAVDALFGDNKCSFGEYCPEGSAEPTPCPPGYHCNREGLSRPSGHCYGGFLCGSRAVAPCPLEGATGASCPENVNGEKCRPGNFCTPVSVIETVAGTGTQGDEADGTVAKLAAMNRPSHALQNSSVNNDIFIADKGNHKVKKLDESTGEVMTIVGPNKDGGTGVGSASPERLAIDRAGTTLYISYPSQNKIILYNMETQMITELSGAVNQPVGMFVDYSDTSLYVASRGSHCIYRIDTATKTVKTWMGSGTAGSTIGSSLLNTQLNGPEDVIVDEEGSVYVADTGNRRILKVTEDRVVELTLTASTDPFDGSTPNAYKLQKPVSLVLRSTNADDTLFVGDETANRIWYITLPEGILGVLAGTGTAGYSGDGNTLPAIEGQLSAPAGIGAGTKSEGQLYDILVADTANNRIRRLSLGADVRGKELTAEPCPAGTYLPWAGGSAIAECIPCPPGMYCEGAGQPVPSGACQDGYYCSRGASSPAAMTCPENHFCKGSTELISVTTGKAVRTSVTSDFVGANSPSNAVDGNEEKGWLSSEFPEGKSHGLEVDLDNYYSISYFRVISGQADGQHAMQSFYLMAWSEAASDWIMATSPVEDITETTYTGAIVQLYTRKIKLVVTQRQVYVSEFLVMGTDAPGPSKPTPCLPGSLQKLRGQSKCDPCPAGFYCMGGESSEPVICPQGFYCPEGVGVADAFPCPYGTYGAATGLKEAADCTLCPPGKYCGARGLSDPSGKCEAGYFCSIAAFLPTPRPADVNPDTLGEVYVNDLCPVGYYCEKGTTAPVPCPSGTMSQMKGAKASSECVSCPPGFACPARSARVPCAAGYVCKQGCASPRPSGKEPDKGGPCSAGFYCPEGSYREQPCLPGTFSEAGQDACSPCTGGYYCARSQIGGRPTDLCFAGSYCPEGTLWPKLCPPGTLSSSVGAAECTPCMRGHYCGGYGLTAPTGLCDAGFVCVSGAKAERPSLVPFSPEHSNYGACPEGHYCPRGTHEPSPCAPGTYQDSTMATSCKPCEPGYYCADYGLTAPSGPCAGGYYCLAGSSTRTPTNGIVGAICPAGWICLEGSFTPQPCPPGFYTAKPGAQSCAPCPKGFACNGTNSQPSPCLPERVCPEGSAFGVVCPSGSYVNKENDIRDDLEKDCIPCPVGKYCRAGTVSGDCAAGYFCGLGNGYATPDPAEDAEGIYIPGYITDEGEREPMNDHNWHVLPRYGGIPCPIGYYCPAGSLAPQKCPSGTVVVRRGARFVSDCTHCPAGYYCAADATPTLCPAGHYCPPGSHQPLPCDSGMYNPSEGAADTDACLACPRGYRCNSGQGAVTAADECPVGHFCPGATATPLPCPPGTHRLETKGDEITDCEPCPPGYYCEGAGNADPTGLCPTGKYCQEEIASPQPCPVGTYCPEGLSEPLTCPAGFYCPAGSGAASPCPPGRFCPAGVLNPESCPPGYSGNPVTASRAILDSACIKCPKGTYSAFEGSEDCQPCMPGYLCFSGCTAQYPTDEALDKGKPCPPGHYCPAGSFEAIPCPVGTYNPYDRQRSLSACLYCKGSTYGAVVGRTTCVFCGGSSVTNTAGTSCRCEGKNRVYLASIQACVCKRGYAHIENGLDLSSQDGNTECIERVAPTCGAGSVRDHRGECMTPTDLCRQQCPSGTGTFLEEFNSCICTDLKTADEVCNLSCRRRMNKMRVTKTDVVFLDSENVELRAIPITMLSGRSMIMAGEPSCDREAACPLIVFNTTEWGLKGLFGPPEDLLSEIERRLFVHMESNNFLNVAASKEAAEAGSYEKPTSSRVFHSVDVEDYINPGILNPVRCIEQGTSIAFMVHLGNEKTMPLYPVYLQESFFNTENNFDFGHLASLETDMLSGADRMLYVHTLTQPGIFVFGLNADRSRYAIIKVVDTSKEKCPGKASYFQPQTETMLRLLGVKAKSTLTLAPDWTILFGTLGGLLLLCLAFSALLALFHLHYWVFPGELDAGKKSFLDYVKERILCAKRCKRDVEAGAVLEDFDPRIFQAIYMELLATQNTLAEGVALVGEQQSKADYDAQDKELQLRSHLISFLRNTLDGLEEAISAQKHNCGTLARTMRLLMLRKDGLLEFVSEMRSNAEHAAEANIQDDVSARTAGLSGSSDALCAAEDVIQRPFLQAEASAMLACALRNLGKLLQDVTGSGERRAILERFRKEIADLDTPYTSMVDSFEDRALVMLAGTVAKDANADQMRENLCVERTANSDAMHGLLIQFDEALSRQCTALCQERARCLQVASTAALDAYKKIEPLLNPQLGEATMLGAYADFTRSINLAKNELQNVVAQKRAHLSNAIVEEARNTQGGTRKMFANRATLLEGNLAELRRTEAGILKAQCDRSEQASYELSSRLKEFIEVKHAVGMEARLSALLLRLEEKFFPDVFRAPTDSERKTVFQQFHAERQRQIEESAFLFMKRKQDIDTAVDHACSQWYGAVLKRQGCDYDLLEARQQLFREREFSFLARDREEGLLGVESLLLSVKAFVQVMEEADKAAARALSEFSRKLEIIVKLDTAKEIIIEGTRASRSFLGTLEEAEKVFQRRTKEERIRLCHQMQKKAMILHAKHAKEWSERISRQKSNVKLKQEQLATAMEAEAKEVEAFSGYIAKAIVEAEIAAKAGLLEYQVEAWQARLLKEEKASLWAEIWNARDEADPDTRANVVANLLENYMSAKKEISEILQIQTGKRQQELANMETNWTKGNQIRTEHLMKIRAAQIDTEKEMESQCEDVVDKCNQAAIELERGLFKKFLPHLSLCRLPESLPEAPSVDAEDSERKTWLDECLEVMRTADLTSSQVETPESYQQSSRSIREEHSKRLAEIREDVSNFVVSQRLEQAKLKAIHSIIFYEDKIGSSRSCATHSDPAEQQHVSSEAGGQTQEDHGEPSEQPKTGEHKASDQRPDPGQQQEQAAVADVVREAELELQQLRALNLTRGLSIDNLCNSSLNGTHDAFSAADGSKANQEKRQYDASRDVDTGRAEGADESAFDHQAQQLVKKLLALRAARRKMGAYEDKRATEDPEMLQERNALDHLKKDARVHMLQDRKTRREQERAIIEAALKKGEKPDARSIMVRRHQAEVDALVACQLREKISVLFFEKEARRAQLEEETSMPEVLREKEGETEEERDQRRRRRSSIEMKIQHELRAHLQKVEEQLEAEHAREVEALRMEHVEQLNSASSARSMQFLPITALLTTLYADADIEARLQQLEAEREESARRRLEEMQRLEEQRKNAVRKEREKKKQAIEKKRAEMRSWRQQVTRKHEGSVVDTAKPRGSNFAFDVQKAAALMTRFKQKVEELANALEQERERQEHLLNSELEKKMRRREERYGEATLAEERVKRPRRVSDKARRKESAAKKLLLQRCGSQFQNLNPVLKQILDEEVYANSFKRFKEEGVLIFRGRFMRLLDQLEKALRRGSFLLDFVEQMHSVMTLTGGTRLSHMREEAAHPRPGGGLIELVDTSSSDDETESSEESESDTESDSSSSSGSDSESDTESESDSESESESHGEEDHESYSSSTSGDSESESDASSSSSDSGSSSSATVSESQSSSHDNSESGSKSGSSQSSTSGSSVVSSGSSESVSQSRSSGSSSSSLEEPPAGRHPPTKHAVEESGSSSSGSWSSSNSSGADAHTQSESSSADENEDTESLAD